VSGCSCDAPDYANVVLADVDVDCAGEDCECGEPQTPTQTLAREDRAMA